MEHTPEGTPVGVDDPYAVAGVCDHLTDDGRCRFALSQSGTDHEFAAERRADGYACHVGPDDAWRACPHYRSTTNGRECARCGLAEIRLAPADARPLVEEHHLMYGSAERGAGERAAAETSDESADAGPHEITVALCRWCHSKVHASFARIDDDANPDSEAIAARESRRSKEQSETTFETARERYGGDESER